MNDFNGSVAQQDVSISTEVKKTAVVGGNFYQSVLYVTDRFEDFGGDTPEFPVVTKDTYVDILDAFAYLSATEKKLIKANLASLFSYGTDLNVYIIPSSEVTNYMVYAYFTYLDLMFVTADGTTSDYTLDASATTTLNAIKDFDKDFTRPIADMPIDQSKVKGFSTATTADTLSQITALTIDIGLFVRAAFPAGVVGTENAYLDATGNVIGSSPALYQLGRSLGQPNESGVPVGNSFDMDAIDFANVLPTGETDPSTIAGVNAVFANYFESVNLNYFKPVGNGTGQLTNMGGWTILNNCLGAVWIVAYLNYMNRVACATIITSGTALKNQKTYGSLLDAVVINIKGQIQNGRVEDFKLTAPSFSELPKTNGHTIVIPNAWEGVYVDNVRKVRISGTLTVAA